jgi:hypothetical protein
MSTAVTSGSAESVALTASVTLRPGWEGTTAAEPDTFTVQLLNSSGTVLTTPARFSNPNAATGYTRHSYDISSYAGQSVTVEFTGSETGTSGGRTTFVDDDNAVQRAG